MQGAVNVGVPIDVMRKLVDRAVEQHGDAVAWRLMLRLRRGGGLDSTVTSSPGPPPAPGAGGVAVTLTAVGPDAGPAVTASTGSGGDGPPSGGPPGRSVETNTMPETRSTMVNTMPEMRSTMVGAERGGTAESATQRTPSSSPDFMQMEDYSRGPPPPPPPELRRRTVAKARVQLHDHMVPRAPYLRSTTAAAA